jgi:hypothetical protein
MSDLSQQSGAKRTLIVRAEVRAELREKHGARLLGDECETN